MYLPSYLSPKRFNYIKLIFFIFNLSQIFRECFQYFSLIPAKLFSNWKSIKLMMDCLGNIEMRLPSQRCSENVFPYFEWRSFSSSPNSGSLGLIKLTLTSSPQSCHMKSIPSWLHFDASSQIGLYWTFYIHLLMNIFIFSFVHKLFH